jgi:hypothetical protein
MGGKRTYKKPNKKKFYPENRSFAFGIPPMAGEGGRP